MMGSNVSMPNVERKAMYILVNQPNVISTQTVDENWFANNSFRVLTSFINLWAGKYKNCDQVKAAFIDTPFSKKIKVDKLFDAIQSVDPPQDIAATFKQLRQNYYLQKSRKAAQIFYKEPDDFSFQQLTHAWQDSQQTDTSAAIDTAQLSNRMLEQLTTPVTDFIHTFHNFDSILGGGLLPNQMIVIGARPSVGKTAFALSLAMEALLHNDNMTVEIFSLEMSDEQNFKRIYAANSSISLGLWKNPAKRMNDRQKEVAAKTIKEIGSLRLWINDKVTRIDEISSIIRKHALQCGTGHYLPIIDHIQLVDSDRARDARERIEYVSRQLKELTQTMKIPMIVLSQLNRAVESRDSPEPNLSDLRETGAIEQDANVVGFLWHDKDDVGKDSALHFSIKKNRDGELGQLEYYFSKDLQKIAEVNSHE